MDKPIPGDKYVRTLSHYLRSNQRRLLVPSASPNGTSRNDHSNSSNQSNGPTAPEHANFGSSAAAANARSFVTPADSMAAAYSGMVSSLWNVTSSVVSTITPSSLLPSEGFLSSSALDHDAYTGAWDGTGAVLADSSPKERQLHLSAQLRSPVFPLDLYYLLYLLERFEQVGIELEGWDGTPSKTVGTSAPRKGLPNATTHASFPPAAGPPATSPDRPQSIRSFSSTALSTLTLITGWKQWSTAASLNSSNLTITDDIHFIHKFLRHVPTLRLVAKIPPGNNRQLQGKGRIEGFSANAMISMFNHRQSMHMDLDEPLSKSPSLLLLPLAATFPALTHLELHKIPAECVDGWETLMPQLKSLVVIQSGIEDVHDVLVTAVINSERRRRQRISRDKNRAVMIKEEQQEALKDASIAAQGSEGASSDALEDSTSNGHSSQTQGDTPVEQQDEACILASLKMWPVLRHLSLSDNSLPDLTRNDTFMCTPSIVSLDLSHNLLLSPPSGLIHLHNLSHLNLSYNMISGVQSIYQILGNIATLDLRGNRLESLSGLERLWNLEMVDVRENHLGEAAEVGRLAALPGIREVWSEGNPFCAIQPKHRLQILAVFKANGHDLLLDGTFASFTEKRALSNMSPSSFSTTISSINNVANIPAASAPVATFAREISHDHRPVRPVSSIVTEDDLSAAAVLGVGTTAQSPVNKLVRKKLLKSNKRVKRLVNLDSDHEDEPMVAADDDVKALEGMFSDDDGGALHGSDVIPDSPELAVKKRKKKRAGRPLRSPTEDAPTVQEVSEKSTSVDMDAAKGKEKLRERAKKRAPKRKETGLATVTFANDEQDPNVDHSLCRNDHHVHRHRLAHLEKSIASIQLERSNSMAPGGGIGAGSALGHQRQASRGILKKAPTMPLPSGAISPRLRPSSPIGSFSSDDGGADGYRRRIEQMRNEAGTNWLMVLAEMDGSSSSRTDNA
ncbi:hypothetical protein KVV02_007275 [Mortierella alpina]|uniref:Uncharacterized protein n=1 Tax=Mortierella alpina TaxID=64518 RepID=A0A9P8A2W8_MORAP|nr:hypothetical protein KVV02_007275 [Mortierella alpina]